MSGAQPIHAELIAVIVAVSDGAPRVLTLSDGTALPAGPLESGHRSLQAGLRNWVERQTGHTLGHIEQLYTFADPDRSRAGRSISISYLGLTRETRTKLGGQVSWQDWYRYFPWEDRRAPAILVESTIKPGLTRWVDDAADRQSRAARCFALDGAPWNEDLALSRYELLYEAGLVREAARDGRPVHGDFAPGIAMTADHRRILATAISRLRATIKYRPVVFELLPDQFTLLDLQRCIEALAGHTLHKGNFRRLIEGQTLLEETGTLATGPGRPAKLYRFSAAIRAERAQAGTRLPLARP
ncbi:MAG: hypothetical protein B7Z58_00400 [Acidiphilium sp. 37-64-53]|nr:MULTISPECIES: hypothetical protein [Acidiphilium]MBW4033978.1 hypothetical protein [Pseudomonadota bacterium]OYW04072.1 MAG: hypothetical protein B7Z58_00400 [Acidiphilium sp. 37-64-53]OZB29005.1 MAG: hypothetical protein B7X49_08430 [Acidiphilium sp. 34-64-41]HQT83307.1 hypothetical protein [Acidiphilium rubrum]